MLNPRKNKILIALAVISIIGIWLAGPIKQDLSYHAFADCHSYFSIPNFWNVVSNLPFLIVGLSGIWLCFKKLKMTENQPFILVLPFFIGITLTGIGSSYYHLHPSNQSLVWDRLPMSVTFVTVFSIIIYEFVSVKIGQKILMPLIFFGIFSLIYPQIIKSRAGEEDLRLYVMVQFIPIVLIIYILLFYKKPNKLSYIFIVLVYVLAKIIEFNDTLIYSKLHFISGHTLKHLIASVAPLILFNAIKKGRACSSVPTNSNVLSNNSQENLLTN